MTTSLEFLKEWRKLGKIPALKIGRYGVQSDRSRLYAITARNLYLLASSAWRLSINDLVAEDASELELVDQYISALITLNTKIALLAQPDLIGLHCPWIRDKQVHYSPRYWLNRLIEKRHAN